MKKLVFILLFLLIETPSSLLAQNTTSTGSQQNSPVLGATKFLLTGDAEASYVANTDENGFGDINFKPIFLWQLSHRLFFETEVEIETGDGEPDIGLEYANMAYTVNPYLIVHAGRFLSLFDGYFGKFKEGFLNRFPSDPVGYDDGGIASRIETGIGIEGNIPVGMAKVNYDLYVSNGPHLLAGSSDAPEEAGQLDYEAYVTNNKAKAIGGRIGILPLSDSSVELGFAFQTKNKVGDVGTPLENTGATMFGLDLNYYHLFTPLKSMFRVNGSWKTLKVDRAQYVNQDDPGTMYTFNNKSSAYYIQASLRPSQSESPLLQNLEFAFRHSSFDPPDGAVWGGRHIYKEEVAMSYWLKWNALLKIGYAAQTGENDQFLMQLVYGF